MKKQPLLDILSASFAAYRINGDYYKETRRFQESPTQFSNKDCLVNQFATEYFPPDWQPMTVTDTDMENAIESVKWINNCLLYTSPSPRDRTRSRMPSSA